MHELTIRDVCDDDAPEIARMWQELALMHFEIDEGFPPPVPGAAIRYAERVVASAQHRGSRAYVAEWGGKVVGFILAGYTDLYSDLFEEVDAGFIADLYVDRDYRRRGIGRRLVDAVLEWFRSQEVYHVEWNAAAANPESRGFWRSVGGRDLLVRMRLDLEESG